MTMRENYVYPAKITHDGEIWILRFLDFPDMGVVAERESEIIYAAQKSLALTILDYEDRRKELPAPTMDASDVVFIHIWMPRFRNMSKEIYVKKNVTIPQWLDMLAKDKKVSYSAAMVKGLKLILDIEDEETNAIIEQLAFKRKGVTGTGVL